jgi:hypothetical protein
MIGRSEHLHDDHLVECYFADRRGEALDPPSAEHLSDCTTCEARYAQLMTFFDDVRTETDAEADAIFNPERLRHQHEQILRRLEHASRSARVISFPTLSPTHPMAGTGSRSGPRWLAAAAAAGLFVGVAVGGTLWQPGNRRSSPPPMRVATTQSAARLAPSPVVLVNTPASGSDSIDDDAFLMQLEFALERPHTQELQPFDALTPHVRPIGVSNDR